MTIPLQSASLYDGQEVFVWSDCLQDLVTDFLVGSMTSFSMACSLLWSSAVRVHDSQAYREMDVTREHISRILDLREILSSFQTGFNLVNAAVVCAILESISDLEPSSVTTEPRYLKLVTISSFCPFILICVDPTGVFCRQVGLLCTDHYAVGCGRFVETLNYFCQFFFLYC